MDNLEDIYELSPAQQGILFHTLYESKSGLYSEQVSFTLSGDLNVSTFEQAWQQVINRHPSLRTYFDWEALNKPLQIVRRLVTLPLEQRDWCQLSAAKQQEQLELYLQTDRRRGFDPSVPPLMRMALFRLAANVYRCVCSYHHLLMDGWSMAVILREVFSFYEAYCSGRELLLPSPRPYRDFITWLQNQDLALAESYWRARLKGFTSPTLLRPQSFPPPDHAIEQYATRRLRFSKALTERLHLIGQQHHLTLNTVVQGAWAVLLSRYSGQADVLYGVTVAGRPAELVGVEQMVGLFINTLPMRVKVRQQAPVAEWLKQLQQEQTEMRQYEHSPLVEVQGWGEMERGGALFESIVILENYPAQGGDVAERGRLQITDVRYDTRTNYPLMLLVTPGKQMSLEITYDSHQYEEWMIQGMLEHLERLLAGIVDDQMQPILELPMLTDTNWQQLEQWNQTNREYEEGLRIEEMFRRQAERTPTTIALTDQHQHLSYQQLNSRANRLAHYLQGLGVGPESIVGLLLSRTVEMVVSVLGVLKAGGAYLPLDEGSPEQRLGYMLGEAGAEVVITERRLMERVCGRGIKLVVVDVEEQRQEIGAHSGEEVESEAGADNLAYVIYTSGSTGRPKGVAIEHRSTVAFLQWSHEVFSNAELAGMLVSTSICFDLSVFELFAPLTCGGTVILSENALQLASLPMAQQVTLINTVPSAMAELLRIRAVPANVHTINMAGEQLKKELVNEVFAKTAVKRLLNLYGPTETTTYSTYYEAVKGAKQPPSIGRPIANTKVYILDADGRIVPPAVTGEMYVAGAGVARGYLHRPELTAERFLPDPYSVDRGARMYRTGDLGRYIGGGEIEYLGRRDEQVKVRGYRIELGEIEEVIREQEWVREVAVVAREGEDGEKRLVAHVVVREGDEGQEQELRRRVSERLPWYMRPEMRMRERLPLSVNGKVDRRRLAEEGEEGEGGSKREREKARSEVEEVLVGIWEEVLGEEEVGIEDDFFELGGHSLRAMQLVSRVRSAFHVELPLRTLFDAATVVELATKIEAALGKALPSPPIRRVSRDEELPLSFAQERLWFLDQLEPGNYSYNMPVVIRLEGLLNAAALEQAMGEIVRRHEALRTNFSSKQGRPIQIIALPVAITIPVIDLEEFPEEEREACLIRLATEEARRPFNLSKDPLWRVTLIKMSEHNHALFFTVHHIVFDGWSTGVFIRELMALYEAFSSAAPSPLPELQIQYADFACWQRQWLQNDLLNTQLSYWERQFDGAPAILELPADRPRPSVQSFQGEVETLVVPETLTAQLRLLSRREGATLFMVLLAAFKTLLYHYTEREDIVVGTPIAGRNQEEVQGLIGLFVNTLVLRTDLSGDPTFIDLLGRVREVAIDAYTHQDLPFEMLVKKLRREGDLSHNPLFQVMFFLQNAPMPTPKLSNLALKPLILHNGTSMFDLTLFLVESEEKLIGVAEYSTDLFDRATIKIMLAKFLLLIERIIENPTSRISEIDLQLPIEKELNNLLQLELDL